MTEYDKQKVRDVLTKDPSWVVVDGILGSSVSFSVWGKEVEIIYENMDGSPCTCRAIYEHSDYSASFFRATNGAAKGNRMCGVIAYRPLRR